METILDPLGLIAGTWNALCPDGFITYIGAFVACAVVAIAHLFALLLAGALVVSVCRGFAAGFRRGFARTGAETPKGPASL